MEDVAGCRAVLLDPAEVTAVAQRIKRKWSVREVSDYREEGKPGTGYRGLHVVVERRGRLVEIQLRTGEQHYWAEVVERTSSATGFALKDGEGPADLLEYLRLASDLTWQHETERPRNDEQFARLVALRKRVRRYFVEQRPPPRRE
jgi:ppGpp synthetase/RelA/SpoT-type nucleotidyltranferase